MGFVHVHDGVAPRRARAQTWRGVPAKPACNAGPPSACSKHPPAPYWPTGRKGVQAGSIRGTRPTDVGSFHQTSHCTFSCDYEPGHCTIPVSFCAMPGLSWQIIAHCHRPACRRAAALPARAAYDPAPPLGRPVRCVARACLCGGFCAQDASHARFRCLAPSSVIANNRGPFRFVPGLVGSDGGSALLACAAL